MIKVFEAFAGIGAQHAALKNIGVDFEIVGVSEWFIDAIQCYDSIHYDGNPVIELPSIEEQREELSKYTFSKNSVDPYDIKKLKNEQVTALYRANKRIKNFGSITEIQSSEIPDMDLIAYSFPCQDLSTGGKTLGMTKGSGTRSGLLWELERILLGLKKENRLPKFLLLENVKAILAKSNEEDFNQWKIFLESIGYVNDEPLLLNATEFGIPQRRSRVFMVSKLGSKLGLKKENMNLSECSNSLNFLCDHNLNKNGKYQTEFDAAQLNNTPSREYMWKINAKILNESTIVNTITCNMDRSNTSAMFEYCGIKGSTYRLLTIREAFKLMGFTDIDYENAKKANLSYRKMNKLIGNSIVVKVLEEIFKGMFGGI